MNARERPATRALLLDAGSTGGFAKHTALCNENNVAIGKFLLEFASKPR